MSLQWKILQLAALKWWDDNALRLSASLSYYTVFSLAPLLIIIMAVAGMVFGQDAVEGRADGGNRRLGSAVTVPSPFKV